MDSVRQGTLSQKLKSLLDDSVSEVTISYCKDCGSGCRTRIRNGLNHDEGFVLLRRSFFQSSPGAPAWPQMSSSASLDPVCPTSTVPLQLYSLLPRGAGKKSKDVAFETTTTFQRMTGCYTFHLSKEENAVPSRYL